MADRPSSRRARLPWGAPALALALAALPHVAGCASAPHYDAGRYREGAMGFRVGALPSAWRRASLGGGGGVTFHHAEGGTIHAGVSCERGVDVPLDVLTNHLLMGLDAREETGRGKLTLDGRAALRTGVAGKLDGVAVQLDLVVLRKDGCTYDLQLAAGPRAFPARRADFDGFLAGFRTEGAAPPAEARAP